MTRNRPRSIYQYSSVAPRLFFFWIVNSLTWQNSAEGGYDEKSWEIACDRLMVTSSSDHIWPSGSSGTPVISIFATRFIFACWNWVIASMSLNRCAFWYETGIRVPSNKRRNTKWTKRSHKRTRLRTIIASSYGSGFWKTSKRQVLSSQHHQWPGIWKVKKNTPLEAETAEEKREGKHASRISCPKGGWNKNSLWDRASRCIRGVSTPESILIHTG